jgi:hypothetical protein
VNHRRRVDKSNPTSKPGARCSPGISIHGEPEARVSGVRRLGGKNSCWAIMRNCGNQNGDAKGEAQGVQTRGESTDAPCWDGSVVVAEMVGNTTGAKRPN